VHANVLTSRHRPEFPDEAARIATLGGEVRQTDGAGPWCVFKRGHSTPGLPLSRSLGDKAAHKVRARPTSFCPWALGRRIQETPTLTPTLHGRVQVGVTAVPDVRELRLTTRDFLCVCGTAGLWEAFPPQEAAEWLWKFAMLRRHTIDLGVALATEAEHRWRAAADDVVIEDIACTVHTHWQSGRGRLPLAATAFSPPNVFRGRQHTGGAVAGTAGQRGGGGGGGTERSRAHTGHGGRLLLRRLPLRASHRAATGLLTVRHLDPER
jgi:hypothetical protein